MLRAEHLRAVLLYLVPPEAAVAVLKQTYLLMPAAVPAGLLDLSLAASLALLTALPQRSMVDTVETP